MGYFRFVRRPALAIALIVGAASPALAQSSADAAAVAIPGPVTILKETARDFVGLASPDSLTVLGIGAGAALAAHQVDGRVNWQLSGSDYQFLNSGDALGHASLQAAAAVGTYLSGRATGNRRTALIGQQLIRAQIVTQVSTIAIKTAVGRRRPDDSNNRSFPSGHASTAFATATVIAGNFGWRVAVPGYLLATGVATSRLRENRHYLSDVVCGSALGIAAGGVPVRRDRRSHVVAQPVVMSGGAGLLFTW